MMPISPSVVRNWISVNARRVPSLCARNPQAPLPKTPPANRTTVAAVAIESDSPLDSIKNAINTSTLDWTRESMLVTAINAPKARLSSIPIFEVGEPLRIGFGCSAIGADFGF